MAGCVAALHSPAPAIIQIRHGYTAACHGCRVSVEVDADGWRTEVRNPADGRRLWEARRSNLPAAKAAGIEFASWQAGAVTNFPVAQPLVWTEHW